MPKDKGGGKKLVKKEATMTLKEKRAAKAAKRNGKGSS